MDTSTISLVISIVGSTIAIIGAMIAMMLWVRSEANNDRRAAQEEMKDFHERLINIEKERNKIILGK